MGFLPGNKNYELVMSLDEFSGGNLTARVFMAEYFKDGTSTGRSGTELMSGSRSGREVTLSGYAWEPGAPADFSLDQFTLSLAADGTRLEGTYRCGGCALDGTLSLTKS